MPRAPFRVAQSFTLSASPTSVASGDLNGDGHPDLAVTRLGSGSVSVLLGNGKGSFSAGIDYPAGTAVSNALVADFNGDGKLDVAVTDSATGSIDVLFGNGDGTFGKPEVYAGLSNALALTAGRFTSSGKLDLAVASATGVDVLLNDGTGHFSAAAAVAIGSQPRSLAAADLKAAGHDDLIVANQDGTLTVLLGDGAGHFSAQPAISAAHGPLSSVIAGDFNSDGKLDLAVAQANSNAVTVLLGRGDGSFEPGVNYAVGNGPARIIAADFNGDGAADLVSINQISNTFSVLLGNGDGTFRPSIDFVSGNTPLGLVAGDFNSDGHADLAIVNSQDQTLAVPLGRGDGTFIATPVYRADLLSKAIAAGDLNGDGRPDLVVSNFCGADSACAGNGTATIFLANADGTYRAASTIALGVGPVSVALADLNGDKKLDLIALNSSDKTLSILAGNGDGTFGKSQLYSLSASPRAVFVGDFNGDGKADLAIASDCGQSACNQPGTLDIWLGRGDGSIAASSSYTVGYSPVSIAAADLRSTGHLDVVVANACGDDSSCKSAGTATLLSNDGTGHFTAAGEVALGSAPSSIAIGNLTGTGLDLAVAERGSNQVAVLHADGKGGFGAPVTYAVGAAPSAVTIADVNGDGRPDVAVAGFQSSTVSVLYGNSSGKLDAAVSFPVGAGPESLVAVSKASGSMAGLVTANGDTGATPMGSGITALGGSDPGTGTTTVAFTTSSNTANVDQQVTITGSVTAVAPTTPTPSGTLVFAIDASGTGAGPFTYLSDCGGSAGVTLSAGGSASCTTQLLPAGTDNIQLQYSGDTTYAASTSTADQAQTISPAATTVTVGATTTGTVDQQVTLNATVAPTTTPTVATNDAVAFSATGTIEFFSDGTPIAGCGSALVNNNATNENATASCQTTALNASGSPHAITAAYNTGDPNYNSSAQSASVNQAINAAATAVTVTSATPASPSVDQSVTFSATVAPSTGAVVIPFSGAMTFYVGGTAISTCTAQTVNTTTGVASCTDAAGLAAGTQQITASYNSGDANYSASAQSTNFPVSVSKAATKVTVNSTTPAAPTVDQTVSITATVAPSSGTSVGSFSGTMSFSVGGAAISGCTTQSVNTTTGVATCNDLAGIAVGTQQITATYSGDSTYAASAASANFPVTVGLAATTASISAAPTASIVDQSVTLTAIISPNVTANEVATASIASMNGKVQFSDGGTAITGCATQSVIFSSVTGTATASCITGVLTAGTHSALTANYLGDTSYSASPNSTATTVTVSKEGPGVTVTANPSAPTLNNPVTYTATITFPSPLGVTPTGTDTVSFSDNGTTISGCSAQPIGVTGTANIYQATCDVSSLTGGSHGIVATFSGDANYLSEIGNLSVSVGAASSTTTVSASPSPSTVNSSVAFTVTVKGGTTVAVSGTASVSSDGNLIGQCTLGTWTAATGASCAVSSPSLSEGTHSITASYSGNSSYNSSSTVAPQLQEVVNKASTNLTVSSSSSGNTSTINTSVTFNANITLPAGTIIPGGTVLFTDTPSGSATSNINGCTTAPISLVSTSGSTATYTAACSTSGLSLNTHTITATYSGDGSFLSSTNTTTQTVTTANSNTVVNAVLNPSVVDETVSFQATVSAPSGNATPSGTMAFTDTVNGVTTNIAGCGAIPLVAGTYVCSTNTLIQGVHTITANYPGDLNFQKSSASTTQTVNRVGSILSLTGSNNTVSANNVATLTFTAMVAPNAGPIYPTGNVVFTDTSGATVATLCTSALSGTGVATCVPTTLPSGTNTITAAYAGDTNFAAVSTPAEPTFAVAVQDFTLTLTGASSVNGVQTVAVTQQSQSTTDMFTPVTLSVVPASISAYSGTVTLTCSSPSTGAPKCDIPPSLSLTGSGTPVPGTVVIDATTAAPGNYNFTLTGTDSVTGLAHSISFTVDVRGLATPTIGIVSGATSGNTATVDFSLPAGVSLSNLECLSVVGTGITKQNVPPSAISVTCSFNPATIPSSTSLQVGSTVVTVNTGATTTASTASSHGSGLLIAGLFGIPIFGMLGLRRGRRSMGSVFLRLIAIFALTAAAYQVMGCGGSFSGPPLSQGQTPPGQYYLLIQGTGTPGNATYQAVVQLDVSL